MSRIILYWEFYKSTLIINWLFSVAISIAASFLFFPFFRTLSISVMTIGPILSLLYNEVSHNNEYYFYYNRGISKASLITTCMVLNILSGIILIKITNA